MVRWPTPVQALKGKVNALKDNATARYAATNAAFMETYAGIKVGHGLPSLDSSVH